MTELSRETDNLLDEGRAGEALDAVHKARLRRAVLAQVAAASIVATTSTAAAWTSAAKTVGVILLVTSAAGGTAALVATQMKASKAPQAAGAVTVPTKPLGPRPLARENWAAALPIDSATAPLASSVPTAAPVASAYTVTVPSSISATPVTKPIVRTGDFTPSVHPAPPPPSSLEEETRLLKDADDALKLGDSTRSLRLLAELANRFPQSALAPERSAERVFALCMAGRRDDARQEAGAFLTVQSTGPLAARVRASCGGE